MRMTLLSAALALLPVAALAQQQQIDSRIAGPMISVLKAEVALRDAALKAMDEDAQKREADLAAWFKGWFGDKAE